MKWALNIVGVILALLGTVWILQGTGIVPVGFMANHIQYAYAGIVVDVIAVGLLAFANWPRKNSPPRSDAP